MKKGHPRFYELLKEMEDLHDRKNNNYAQDNDPLSNLRSSEQIGISAEKGNFVRMLDKWSRLIQLMNGKQDLVGESIKDTLIDLANYSLLEIILLEERERAIKEQNIRLSNDRLMEIDTYDICEMARKLYGVDLKTCIN